MVRFLLVLFACLLALPVQAGLSPSSFRTLRLEETLPGAAVHAMATDARGQLWAGTSSGLAAFTGVAWRQVPIGPENRSFSVRSLLASRDGSLWVGTEQDGLWRLREGRWTFVPILQGQVHLARIQTLLETGDGQGGTRLLAGTDRGLAILEEGVWRFQDILDGLPDRMIWKLREIREPDGSIRTWAATAGGTARFRNGRWERIPEAGSHSNDVLDVDWGDGRREVWVSLWNEGLARWDGRTWARWDPRNGFPSRNPTGLAETRDGTGRRILWAGTYDAGLAWFDGAWHGVGTAEGFPSLNNMSLLALPGGRPSLLAGTRNAGIQAVDLGGWSTLGLRQGLPDALVTAFAEERLPGGDAAVWMCTPKGLSRWDEATGKVRAFQAGMPSAYVQAVLPASDGLWAASIRGLMRYDGRAWQLLGKREGFPPGSVGSLAETVEADGGHTLWAGLPQGLAWRHGGVWSFLTAKDGFPASATTALRTTRDPDGPMSLWVSTRNDGIRRYRQGTWLRYGIPEGLPTLAFSTLCPVRDAGGRPWMWGGAMTGALAFLPLDRPGARWQALTRREIPDLPDSPVRGLTGDRQGRLYVLSQKGIIRITFEEGTPTPRVRRVDSFTMGDGLPDQAGYGALLDSRGRIWAGTLQGAAIFDPSRETPLPPLGAPTIQRAERTDDPAPLQPSARLDHGHRNLFFEFGLPVHARFEDTRFRTQLAGWEKAPGPWRKTSFREFTGLPPGAYRLRVWARNFAGLESGPVEFPFVILPAPWLTPWAFAAYALALAGLATVAWRTRTRILRQRARELEKAVKAAVAELGTLRGLIPICAYCKKIRDDRGSWEQLERYIGARSEARFSHGICPECRDTLRAEVQALRDGAPPPGAPGP